MKAGDLFRNRRHGRRCMVVDVMRWQTETRKHELVVYRYLDAPKVSKSRGIIVGRRMRTMMAPARFLDSFARID